MLAALAWAWQGAEMNPMALVRDSSNMATFASDFFPPDFREWRSYLKEMLVTIQIALWGTVLAIVCSIPLGILCAENITPWWIHLPLRRCMDAFRSINEMVFAMLFVDAVGSRAVRRGVGGCGSAPPAYWPSCLPKPSRRSNPDRSRACVPPEPARYRK